MKKWLLFLLLILAACNRSEPNENPDATHATYVPIDNQIQSEVTDRSFHITLQSAKEVYELGEPIEVFAELENITEQNIQIGHGESWVTLGTTNISKDYQFGFLVTEPYITQTIDEGETNRVNYRFSGVSYDLSMSGKSYSENELMKMSDMEFPKGQYEITAIVNFKDISHDEFYEHKLSVVFEVK